MTMNHRASWRGFTLSALVTLACVAMIVTGCHNGVGSSFTGPSGQFGISYDQVSTNHGHAVAITADQLMTGVGVRLDIQGRAEHAHTLNLGVEDVALINSGAGVQLKSSANAEHDHVVTFPNKWDY